MGKRPYILLYIFPTECDIYSNVGTYVVAPRDDCQILDEKGHHHGESRHNDEIKIIRRPTAHSTDPKSFIDSVAVVIRLARQNTYIDTEYGFDYIMYNVIIINNSIIQNILSCYDTPTGYRHICFNSNLIL